MPAQMKSLEKQKQYNQLFGKYFSPKGLTEKEMHQYQQLLINRAGTTSIKEFAGKFQDKMNKMPPVGEQNQKQISGEVYDAFN
jgi:hypothetical protein